MLGFAPGETSYNCLPLFHANSLLVTLMAGLPRGATTVFGERFSASGFWDEVKSSGATIISLLGSMVPILWNRPPAEDDSDNRVRVALAVPTPPISLHEAFEERFGLTLASLYGMTDIGLPIGTPCGVESPPGTCGIAHPDWECIVADEHDEEVPHNVAGELLVRPRKPFTMQMGYWRNPEATVETWRNLWFHTGDVLVRDDVGWFQYVDRKKDAIRRFGENISSFEVEMVVQTHPAVAEVAVYAVPAELSEDEVMAAVVLEPGMTCTPADLAAHCEELLPYFAVPRYVEMFSELPKTQTAKVQKEQLRERGVTPSTWDAGPRGKRAQDERERNRG
jgi:crotonobetaine/carnitine-CoA ligase